MEELSRRETGGFEINDGGAVKEKLARWWVPGGRLILAAIFIFAAWAKLREPWINFAGSLNGYELLPVDWLEPLAKTLPWCELALGIALLSGFAQRWFLLIATLLLALFFSVMVRSYAVGLHIDCGCFGAGDPLGPKTLARDGSLLALGIAVTFGAFRANRKITS